ncbi:acyl-CoA dehydrogenase family protein [Paenibacillus sp. NPDC058071]|uniref:acyl-CoA dehydrogenase family protein n=1 Tax=Paenibacillus sp. NPDC058071 TaxID=3346326 RepID=UPI0036DD8AA0
MRFQLSAETELVRSVIREFAEREVGPGSFERDKHSRFDRRLFAMMGELGLTGSLVPEAYGGTGAGALAWAAALEEVAGACASTAASLAVHAVYAAGAIVRFGSERLKEETLPQLAEGKLLGGFCPPAPAGSGPLFGRLSNGNRRLGGSIPIALNGADADICIVFAQPDGDSRRLTGFALDMRDCERIPIKTALSTELKLGLRGLTTTGLTLDGMEAAQERRLGRAGQGTSVSQSLFGIANLSAAAQSVGVAEAALRAAKGYAKERRQFGKPIARRQGISFKLADMAVRTEAARLLVYQAAWRMDSSLPSAKEAAIARVAASQAAVYAASEAVQIFGGYGYMAEYRIERLLRDAQCLASPLGAGGMDTNPLRTIITE